jgi:putative ABC transport system permease protein
MYRDLVFALRQVRTNLRFSLIVVLTLALGMGATTAIFSLVSGILLRTLPFPEPDRLVSLQTLVFPSDAAATKEAAAGTPDNVSFPDFLDWSSQTRALDGIASYSWRARRKFTPAGNAQPRVIEAEHVSADFFRVLGIAPLLGRSFTVQEEREGICSVILSYEFWSSDFGSSPDVAGKSITLNDRPCAVVGVMPAGFTFPYRTHPPSYWGLLHDEVYTPDYPVMEREDRRVVVIGRLKSGISLAQARADMNVIQQGLAQQYAEDRSAFAVKVSPLLEYITGDFQEPLYMLFAAVAALLLIACVNVAGLLLARGFTRRNEFAVRVALGANPSHIVRQVLIESTVLACFAGALGIAIAFVLLRIFLGMVPDDLPRLSQVRIDGPVLAFAFLASLLTGVCFGVFPAWRASRSDPSLALSRTRGSGGSRHEQRLHGALVVAETAISLLLLAGSGLLIRSFLETMRVPPGFDPHHTLTLRLGMSTIEYPSKKALVFFRQLLPLLRSIPGVQSVSAAQPIPFTYDNTIRFKIAGRSDPMDPLSSNRAMVEPSYFETLRIPLLRGRTFDENDGENAKRVAIVTQEFARKFFPAEEAIGKSIQPDLLEDGEKPAWYEIVGVVGSIRTMDLTDDPHPEFFLPYEQAPQSSVAVILRCSGDPRGYVNSVRSAIAQLDRDVPIFQIITFDELIAKSTWHARFQAQLLACFAVSALLLAAVGLYAALSEMVARRTSEIGLRVALGAQRGDVFQLIVKRGFLLALVGLAIGLSGFVALVRFLSDMLYGIRPFDPLTLAAVSAIILCVSLLASAAPAWRAARLEPTDALREQ